MLRARIATEATAAGTGSPGPLCSSASHLLGGGVRQRDRVVGRQEDQPGGLLVLPALRGQRADEHCAPQPLGQIGRERAERVEVLAPELDLGHAARRLERQPVLDHLARRQKRGGVHRQHAHAVERHRAAQDPARVVGEVARAAATVDEPHEVVAKALG
jgi:hypothetical protein